MGSMFEEALELPYLKLGSMKKNSPTCSVSHVDSHSSDVINDCIHLRG